MTGVTKKKFLSAEDIERAISEVAELSKGTRVFPVLAGGSAMQLYGSDRLTKDVDFVAKAIPAQISVEKKLSFGGVSGKTPGGLPVCFILRDDDFRPLYLEAHKNAIDVGRPVKVITPEYLAAMKLVAGRGKDEEDLRILLRLKAVDLPKARGAIKRTLGAFAVKEFDSYVDEVEWRRSRDEA